MKIPCECVAKTELWVINLKLWGTQQIARILMVHLLQPLPGFVVSPTGLGAEPWGTPLLKLPWQKWRDLDRCCISQYDYWKKVDPNKRGMSPGISCQEKENPVNLVPAHRDGGGGQMTTCGLQRDSTQCWQLVRLASGDTGVHTMMDQNGQKHILTRSVWMHVFLVLYLNYSLTSGPQRCAGDRHLNSLFLFFDVLVTFLLLW